MLTRFKRAARFRKGLLQETAEGLNNPGQGWYHVYTFVAGADMACRDPAQEVWMDETCRSEQLALVLVDISFFRNSRISEEALGYISRILEFFRREGKQMILRFVYDREGKCRAREPESIDRVMKHMEQIGAALADYMADILVLQGIFVGNWGEMHGSRYLGKEEICELVNCLYEATKGGCFLAVRTPAQWRMITEYQWILPGVRERLGLFNDGIFGSETDLGTYRGTEDSRGDTLGRDSTGNRVSRGQEEKWSRTRELAWQRRWMGLAVNGGEVLAGSILKSYDQAAEEMSQMHLGYLNSVYQEKQLAFWKEEVVAGKGCWDGISGYEYIGRHLGYRFVIRRVQKRRGSLGQKSQLQIVIENVGFGCLCQEAECILAIEREGQPPEYRSLETDARQWESGRQTIVTVQLQEEEKRGRLYLLLRRKSDGRILRFANRGGADKVLLGEFADG